MISCSSGRNFCSNEFDIVQMDYIEVVGVQAFETSFHAFPDFGRGVIKLCRPISSAFRHLKCVRKERFSELHTPTDKKTEGTRL